MPLSDLSNRTAVLQALAEFDQLGRDRFLQTYGFGPSRSYFVLHDGKRYDSKAIAGVAFGKQFPAEGPLRSANFSGGEATVQAKLEQLGFIVEHAPSAAAADITTSDVELLSQSRRKGRYANLSPEELAAYRRIHLALAELGRVAIDTLGDIDHYKLKLTSSFSPVSGVRGAIPKDLWFGIYRHENEDVFLGNPQIYVIVSMRGVELGFAASTHPSDFSNTEIKARLRAAAPRIYDLLPEPNSPLAQTIERSIGRLWFFRRKSRLDPGHADFPTLGAWLAYLKSPQGKAEGGGCISRYLTIDELDQADLPSEVRSMAQTFKDLMISVSPSDTRPAVQPSTPSIGEERRLATLFATALRQFSDARNAPYKEIPALWATMSELRNRLEQLDCVTNREHILIKWSLGKGVWANVPWIALLNRRLTTSTQNGLYVVDVLP